MNAIPHRLVKSTLSSSFRCSKQLFETIVTSLVTFPSPHQQCRPFASGKKTGADHHAFFQEQMLELEIERKSFFGEDADDQEDSVTKSMDGQEQHAFFAREMEKLEQERKAFFGESIPSATYDTPDTKNKGMTEKDLEKMHQEREAIFEFSNQEKQAWSQQGGKLSPLLMMEIAEARAARERGEVYQSSEEKKTEELHHPSFSHVSREGDSVHMVDVGHKKVTARMAEAQTKVILPDSVMEAFGLVSNTDTHSELIGPKGPILATAKLAGIMAAK